MDTGTIRATEDEALQFHAGGRPGKLSIAPTKRSVSLVGRRNQSVLQIR